MSVPTIKQATKFPRYVTLNGTALRRIRRDRDVPFTGGGYNWSGYRKNFNREEPVIYFRDAGDWAVAVSVKGDKLYSVSTVSTVNNRQLLAISAIVWRKDNKGWV